MRFILPLISLLFGIIVASGEWVLTNPVSDALGEIQHIEDIAKSIEMINNQGQQINALTQQLQQIQDLICRS